MKSIISEAKNIALSHQRALLLTLLYLGLFSAFRDLLIQSSGVFSLGIALVAITIKHGEVVAGLKAIRDEEIEPQKDAASGIVRIRELWITYGWMMLITLVCFIIIFVILYILASPYLNSLLVVIKEELEFGIQATYNRAMGLIMLIVNVGLVISDLLFNTFFFLTPYIAESKKIYGFKAIKKAFKAGKEKRKLIISLFGHYFVYMICFLCLEYLSMYFISGVLWLSFIDIALTIIAIFVYESEFVVVKGLLFQMIYEEGY